MGAEARPDRPQPGPSRRIRLRVPDPIPQQQTITAPLLSAACLLVDPLEVAARARVDLDPFAFFDEERDVDRCARRELGRLRGTARGVALDTGLALGDLKNDARRKLDSDRIAVVDRDFAVEPLAQKPNLIAHGVFHHVDLVAGARVHENEAVALVPRVAHLVSLDVGDLDRLAGLPGALDDGARRQVFDATAGKGLA